MDIKVLHCQIKITICHLISVISLEMTVKKHNKIYEVLCRVGAQ